MSISTPTDLVNAFKKSGEYDRLRRELLVQFQKSEGIESFKLKIEENIRSLLMSDSILRFQLVNNQGAHKTLMDQVERFPTVERAVTDLPMLSDPVFTENIRESIKRILKEDKGIKDDPQATSTPDHENNSPHVDRLPDVEAKLAASAKNKDSEDLESKPQRQPSVQSPSSDAAAKSPLPSLAEDPTNAPPPATLATVSSADREETISKMDTVATSQ
ncbi:hypothetical protein VNI00_000955 [Paramarasmius palmivorus]|uniref:BOD1/SHG1 domain-containing protein n=1 Tax=Paramarasmius palmivorus TaxID=297713 RepID=A0AAW0E7K7_9AGAR